MDQLFEPAGGQCQACGCTDDHACEGGCIWANARATLCSRCARDEGAPLLELLDDEQPLELER